ncbi:MAG TPA: DUF3482 domain-containing protein [Planctomycetota bacterium]
MTPSLAVVGRINEGKSSIVSTLAEDDSVEVSEHARTTTRCHRYPVRVDGELLYTLVDTPGFGNAPRALRWMKERSRSADDRVETARAFVREHREDPDFRDECELLGPILEGAGILYVVDASHPFTVDFEAEMEILQWTGRPRMALLNQIRERDHGASWARVLDQYFKHHVPFNAHAVGFADRIEILKAFRLLQADWRAPLDRAVDEFQKDWERRRERAAAIIGGLIFDALHWSAVVPQDPATSPQAVAIRSLTELEARAREAVERLYRHARLKRAGGKDLSLEPGALFSRETWKRQGLTLPQRLAAWAGAGATTGGAIDVGVGGASFFAGAVLGGAIGLGVGVWREKRGGFDFRARWLAKDRKEVTVGPVTDPEFPVVLFNRALGHYRLVRDRAHGRRDDLLLKDEDRPLSRLPDDLQRTLMKLFKELIRGGGSSALKTRLNQEVEKALLAKT